MSNYYVRQSCVVPKKEGNKLWREFIIRECIDDMTIICSNFDHYSKAFIDQPKSTETFIKLFKCIGYKKTISFKRLLSHWIFSLKVAFFGLKTFKAKDKVISSFPTPECAFILSLLRFLKGYELIIDYRDAWPDALPKTSLARNLFHVYVQILKKLTVCNKSLFMSDRLKDYYLSDSVKALTLPNPIIQSDYNTALPLNNKVLFFGNFNNQYSCKGLSDLKALECLQEKEFIFYGRGDNYLRYKDEFEDERVKFPGFIEYDKLQTECMKCFCFFILFENKSIFKNHFTNKISEMIAFDKPIISNLDSMDFTINDKIIKVGFTVKEIQKMNDFDKITSAFKQPKELFSIDRFKFKINQFLFDAN